jgi:hypothetical protein
VDFGNGKFLVLIIVLCLISRPCVLLSDKVLEWMHHGGRVVAPRPDRPARRVTPAGVFRTARGLINLPYTILNYSLFRFRVRHLLLFAGAFHIGEKAGIARPSFSFKYIDPGFGCPRVPVCNVEQDSPSFEFGVRISDPAGFGVGDHRSLGAGGVLERLARWIGHKLLGGGGVRT